MSLERADAGCVWGGWVSLAREREWERAFSLAHSLEILRASASASLRPQMHTLSALAASNLLSVTPHLTIDEVSAKPY